MRRHGRNGLVYLSVHNGDQASPLTYLSSWSISFTHDTIETTTFTSTERTYVAGLVDVAGSFTGFWDDATSQTYAAAVDGLPRNLYLYPDSQNLGQFFSGQVLADFSAAGGSTAAAAVSVSWVAAGQVTETTDAGAYGDVYEDSYT